MNNKQFSPGNNSWRPSARPAQPSVKGAPLLPKEHQPVAPSRGTAFNSIDAIRPVTHQPRTAAPVIPPSASKPSAAPTGNANVTININVPKFKKPELPKLPWKRIARWALLVAILVAVSIALRFGINAFLEYRRVEKIRNTPAVIERSQPSFSPAIPKSNPDVAKAAAYDSKRDTYSYNDKLKGTQIVISQQPLPTGTTPDNVLARIAKSIDATTPLSLEKGTAYMASNIANGSQTIVMTTSSSLVFVQSAFKHSSEEWVGYLNNLSV